MAEHHDLDVLVRLGPSRGSEQAEVTEDEGNGRSWSLVANTASSGQQSRFWCPTAFSAIEILVPYNSRDAVAAGDETGGQVPSA